MLGLASIYRRETMPQRTERDFWVEMSVREIWTQCHFAELAYMNLDSKARANIDAVFSSIHSFLSHCAMVSKLLRAKADSVTIEDVLKVSTTSKIHDRSFRNHLEHYDKRLKTWIKEKGLNAGIGTYNIGPKSMLPSGVVFVSHYDPTSTTFTFVDEDINLRDLHTEIGEIKKVADAWVKNLRSAQRSGTSI
jgi:hypothetical protein